MSTDEMLKFELEILVNDSTEEELDTLTRGLLSELQETNVEKVSLVSVGKAPEGSKGDLVTLGQLALEVLPTAVPSVIALIQAWIMRGQGRTVKFKGKGIEFEGSPEELKKLLASLEKGGKKKK
jgi:hypothetical protein